jgi:ArsR family transcriptional regulator, arsenate/arsenite/antimonite-responsive transcriptional repressor
MKDLKTSPYEEIARLLKVLGHPDRLAMVEALRFESWCVCELAVHLGLNKSAASKHLNALRELGVIAMEKDGTRVNCTLRMPCVFEMMQCASDAAGQPIPPAVRRSCPSGTCSADKEKNRHGED